MDEVEIKAQVERLERVKRKPHLLELVPRVAAAGFGVIPLGDGPGWLEVAAGRDVSAGALEALGRVLGRELRVVRVREALVHVYLGRLYPRSGGGINFHTFLDEDFLADRERAKILLTEKPHEPVAPAIDADRRSVVLLDYAYRSEVENLDGPPETPSFEAGGTDLAFAIEPDGGALLQREKPLPGEVLILAQESYATLGGEYSRGLRAHEVTSLPHMIHPTELQITGVARDGSLDVLVYDDVVTVHPGDTPTFRTMYCFLSMGQRLRRHLTLRIYGLARVPRRKLRLAEEPLGWTLGHLERWLGHDLETAAGPEPLPG